MARIQPIGLVGHGGLGLENKCCDSDRSDLPELVPAPPKALGQ